MVYRTYGCDDCGNEWEVSCAADDPAPDCPTCTKILDWRPKSFAIGGSNASKAVDYTQNIMEQDYGLTNFRDSAVEGESAAIMPKYTTSENEQLTREVMQYTEQTKETQVKNDFWGQNHGQASHMNTVTAQGMIAAAKVGPQGVDPMAMLHQGVKTGKVPSPQQMTRIEAAADMHGNIVRAGGKRGP
jgi:hypothetical protein